MATITREQIGKLHDKITVKVAKEDYLPTFEKTLKSFSKTANIPGFRKGQVPVGMIKKMHGPAIFTEEVLKTVEKEINNYMSNEQLEIFAQPLPMSENDASKIDMNQPNEYAFAFEIGLKPAFEVADLSKETMTSYKVTITPDMLQEEVNRLQLRHGKMSDPETTTCDDNILNVTFTESDAQGNVLEGAESKENSLLVKYFAESFRPQLLQKTKDDSFVIQMKDAFDAKEREWVMKDIGLDKNNEADASKYFKMHLTKIGLVERAELNEDLFKAAFPGQEIADADAFKAVVEADIQKYWDQQSSNHLQHELYHVLLDHTTIEFPESFLKSWLQQSGEKPKTEEEATQELPSFLNQLKWTLIIDKLTRENQFEIKPEDLKAFATQQLMGYMGGQIVDTEQPWIADYVNRMMQDRKFVEDAYHRIQTEKIFQWAETKVNKKDHPVSVEEFTKELEKHQHHHH